MIMNLVKRTWFSGFRWLKSRWFIYPVLLILTYPLAETAVYSMMKMNGFVIDDPLIPANEIYQGGPPRDGIPSIDNPSFISVKETTFLSVNDRVLGLTFNGVTKAYAINILNYHELVNDEFNGHPVVVSFCPLCGTGMAFDALMNDKTLEFGVSGLLYNSDLLMYDRQSDSLWSQIEGKAVSGPAKGVTLERLPVEHTSWGDWVSRHPNSLVLSNKTGYKRDYQGSPYPGYNKSEGTYFPVSNADKRYHPKEVIVGLEVGGKMKAYPFIELAKGKGILKDSFEGQVFTIEYDASARSAKVKNDQGELIPSLTVFWFAWVAFHPETLVYTH
jgi:hypothetical protein